MESISIRDQKFLLQKTISKQVVVIFKIKKLYWSTKHISKLQGAFRKIGVIGVGHIGRLNKKHFNEKINGKAYYTVFLGVNIKNVFIPSSNLFLMITNQMLC